MAPAKDASEKTRAEALRVALAGLASGDDPESTVSRLAELYRNDTFAGEDLLKLAVDAIEESGASVSDPIDYAGMTRTSTAKRISGGWRASGCTPSTRS